MKKILKIILVLLFYGSTNAQQSYPDSLRMQIEKTDNDTLRMNYYMQLGGFYQQKQFDSALYSFDQALTLARQLGLRLNEASAMSKKGEILKYMRNYPESWQSLSDAVIISEDPETEKTGWSLPELNREGFRRYRLSILVSTHMSLSSLYEVTGDTVKQYDELFKARKIAEEINDLFYLTRTNLSIAVINGRQQKFDSAFFYYQKAIAFSEQTDRSLQGYILYSMGLAYFRKGDHESAKKYIYDGIRVSKELNNLSSSIRSYNAIALVLIDEGDTDSSLYYVTKSRELAEQVNSTAMLEDVYSLLVSVYKLRNNADSALKYQELLMAARDSLNETDNLKKYLNISFEEQQRLQQLEKERIQYQGRVRSYAMLAGLAVLFLLSIIFYRNFRHRQKAAIKIEKAYNDLKATQQQLIQQEKMASLGKLTSGIAHEIQNPLNFVNNFSDVNKELLEELKENAEKGNLDEIKTIADNVIANEEKIILHGSRADAIVKNMLLHSQSGAGAKEPTNINVLAEESLRLSFNGIRVKDKSFNAKFDTKFDGSLPKINIVPQDIGRVILNLTNNAFYAVNEKAKHASTGSAGQPYEPTIIVSTKKSNGKIEISVKDNGNGIPDSIKEKIFQPFFTTKPTGSGTGLGLSLSYDIVKAHGGELKMQTKEGEGTTFIISIPANQ